MSKSTLTKDDLPFVYQLGQDVSKLGTEIDNLKNKSVKAVRIVIPAKPDKYQQYELKAVINLPPECQHAICIKSENGQVSLIETGETMSVYANSTASEFYLAPIYRLETETINAALDQEEISNIDAAQERAELERKEQQEREKRNEAIYKYLAKWLTDNYLDDVQAKARNSQLEQQGIKVYVNKNGLATLLDRPFERNSNINKARLDESTYADAKMAMLAEKDRIDRGEVDLSTASDFNVVDYNYIEDFL